MTGPAPLRSRLPAIPVARARLQTEVIAALNSREVEGLTTVARLASVRDRRAATTWIDFLSPQGVIAVAPLLVDGTLAHLTRDAAPDGVAAAATLERIEPLVAAAETALGVELQPHGLSEAVDEDANVLFRLDGHAGQGIAHRLILAVPETLRPATLPLPARIPTAVARLRPAWGAQIAGPAISAARRSVIAPGDLILLGAGALFAKLSLPGRNDPLWGRLDLVEAQVVVGQDRGVALDGTAQNAPAAQAGEWGSVKLPCMIEFEGGGFTAAELAGIAEGSVLPLPALGGTLPVRVRIGDQGFCSGELVAVGEGYGVLVTALSQPPAAG